MFLDQSYCILSTKRLNSKNVGWFLPCDISTSKLDPDGLCVTAGVASETHVYCHVFAGHSEKNVWILL